MRRTFRRIGFAAGAMAAATGIVWYGGTEATAEASPANASTGAVVTGCAIRFTSSGPAIHANATHICTGAKSVSVEADGDLLIKSTPRGPVVSITAEEDETLARRGFIAGPSGGVGTTVVRFTSTKTGVAVRADSPLLRGTYSNLWMTWVNAG